MAAIDDLRCLLVPLYLQRAVDLATRGRWADAQQYLSQTSSLDSSDYRTPLLQAKICLHSGRLDTCLGLLAKAKSLGHNATENDRMVHYIQDLLDRESARQQERKLDPDLDQSGVVMAGMTLLRRSFVVILLTLGCLVYTLMFLVLVNQIIRGGE